MHQLKPVCAEKLVKSIATNFFFSCVLPFIENIEQKKRSEEKWLSDKVRDFADKENQGRLRVGNKTKVSVEEQIPALVELNTGHVPKQIHQKLKKLKRGLKKLKDHSSRSGSFRRPSSASFR